MGPTRKTELGHGSNVAGIETTATFDQATDSFILNSPTVSSTKYWIGATGVWATHSIVVAKLIINNISYGNHLFLTQLRDLSTQALLPGVEIHELGPKAFQGMLGTDNGALRFHSVRVPRSQMLARNAQVDVDGTYHAPTNTKHSYGSMVTVRALMAEITGWDLLRAVAVAYHYTTFRKQFWANDTKTPGSERPVFSYASVRHRLLPLLAQGTALVLVGQSIKNAYDDYTASNLATGDTSQLAELHLQTVGAKVYATELTGRGIEDVPDRVRRPRLQRAGGLRAHVRQRNQRRDLRGRQLRDRAASAARDPQALARGHRAECTMSVVPVRAAEAGVCSRRGSTSREDGSGLA